MRMVGRPGSLTLRDMGHGNVFVKHCRVSVSRNRHALTKPARLRLRARGMTNMQGSRLIPEIAEYPDSLSHYRLRVGLSYNVTINIKEKDTSDCNIQMRDGE
jgi:hypothetical protein